MTPTFSLTKLFCTAASSQSNPDGALNGDSTSANSSTNKLDLFELPVVKAEKEEVVKFLHARLPCVPIKVIRANSLEPEAKVYAMRSNDGSRALLGAVVYKDHSEMEFREVKYFCTLYPGGGIGSRLMTALKLDAIQAGLFYIVLYASNTAIQFFAKQQFVNFPADIVGLPKQVVLARIEQYQRSTLMACDLLDNFPESFLHLLKSLKKVPNVGDRVLVAHGMRHARDEPGIVKDIRGKFKIKINYPKWTSDTEEWITIGAKRLKLLTTELDDKLQETPIHETVEKPEAIKSPNILDRIKRFRIT